MPTPDHSLLLGPDGSPIRDYEATLNTSLPRPLTAPSLEVPTLQLPSSDIAILDSQGNPLSADSPHALIVSASELQCAHFGTHEVEVDSTPIDQQQLLQVTLNPFRKTRDLFEEVFSSHPSLAAVGEHVHNLLHGRIAALNAILGNGYGLEAALAGTRPLELSRGGSDLACDFSPRQEAFSYHQKGESATMQIKKPSAIEQALNDVLRRANEDPLVKATAVRLLVYDTVADTIRHVRLHSPEHNPELTSLSCSVIDLVEQSDHTREERAALYEIASECRLSSALSERLLDAMANHRTRISPGEYTSDLSHPLAFMLLTTVRSDATFKSAFVSRQELITQTLLEVLEKATPQSLFDRFDELSNLMDQLVYSGSTTDAVGGNCGIEIEYKPPHDESSQGPDGFRRVYDSFFSKTRELQQKTDRIGYDERWEKLIADTTHYLNGEASPSIGSGYSSPHFSIHYHVDQATSNSAHIKDVFATFFYESSRKIPLNDNTDFNTWEIRGLIVPNHGNWINPARVTDIARLALQCNDERSPHSERLSLNPDKPYTHQHLLWGHLVTAMPSGHGRLAALGVLKDPRIVALADPVKLASRFNESSQLQLIRELSYHAEAIDFEPLHERFGSWATTALFHTPTASSQDWERTLIRLLRHPSETARVGALDRLACGDIPLASRSIEHLCCQELSSESSGIRASAVRALAMSLQCVITHQAELVAMTQDASPDVRIAAAEAIHRHAAFWNPAVETHFSLALSDPNPASRLGAAQVLARTEELATRYAPQLVALLADNDQTRQREIIELLASTRTASVWDALEAAIQSDEMPLKRGAFRYASFDDEFAAEHKDDILSCLRNGQSGDGALHVQAITIIKKWSGQLDAQTLTAVGALLDSSDPAVRSSTIELFGSYPGKINNDIINRIARSLGDPEPSVRSAALGVMTGRDGLIEAHLSAIVPLLGDEDIYLPDKVKSFFKDEAHRHPRLDAALCELVLRPGTEKGHLNGILALTNSTDSIVRNSASLAQCLVHPNTTVQAYAASSLVRTSHLLPRHTVDTLVAVLQTADQTDEETIVKILSQNPDAVRRHGQVLVNHVDDRPGSVASTHARKALANSHPPPDWSATLTHQVQCYLTTGSDELRQDLITILARTGRPERFVDVLAPLLEIPPLRGATLQALAHAPQAVPDSSEAIVGTCLREGAPNEKRAALSILTHTPDRLQRHLGTLLACLDGTDFELSCRVLRAMPAPMTRNLSTEMVDALLRNVNRDDELSFAMVAFFCADAEVAACNQSAIETLAARGNAVVLDALTEWVSVDQVTLSESALAHLTQRAARTGDRVIADSCQRLLSAAQGGDRNSGTDGDALHHEPSLPELFSRRLTAGDQSNRLLRALLCQTPDAMDESMQLQVLDDLNSDDPTLRDLAQQLCAEVPGLFGKHTDHIAAIVCNRGLWEYPALERYLLDHPDSITEHWEDHWWQTLSRVLKTIGWLLPACSTHPHDLLRSTVAWPSPSLLTPNINTTRWLCSIIWKSDASSLTPYSKTRSERRCPIHQVITANA